MEALKLGTFMFFAAAVFLSRKVALRAYSHHKEYGCNCRECMSRSF